MKTSIVVSILSLLIIVMNYSYLGELKKSRDFCVCNNVCDVEKVMSECELDCVLEKRHHIKIIDKHTRSGEIKWKKIK